MSSTDTDKLELLADGINGIVDVAEDVFEDGKVDFSDIDQIQPLKNEIEKIVNAGKAYKEMVAEAKDIDPIEAVKIVQILFAKK